ncbi:Uncharacterised protein [Yersinia aleksiciae]|uniref:Uncharacterized protein n=1 Tax=Yersinia aleksiciae TaxID=263819 RepID=A0A0T9TTT8_YERAE|nr:Uncharacterised protein [Yersinia aleksiciae]CNL01715.1 Uncharacterised protein [Yersinia aleksiciae]
MLAIQESTGADGEHLSMMNIIVPIALGNHDVAC